MPDPWPQSKMARIGNLSAVAVSNSEPLTDEETVERIASAMDISQPIMPRSNAKAIDPKDLTPESVVKRYLDQGYTIIGDR